MKILLSRDGFEKSKVNTGQKFDDKAAVLFLADIFLKENAEETPTRIN